MAWWCQTARTHPVQSSACGREEGQVEDCRLERLNLFCDMCLDFRYSYTELGWNVATCPRLTQSNGSLALSRLQSVCFRPGAQNSQDTNWVFWLAEIHSTQLNGGIMTAVSCLESVIRRGSFYNLCLNQCLSVQRYSVKRCGTFKIYFGLPGPDSLILSNLTLKKHIWLLGTELI